MSILNSTYSVRATTIDVATLDELRDQNFVTRYPPLYHKKPELIQVQLDTQDDSSSQNSESKKPIHRLKRFVRRFRRPKVEVESPKMKISPIMTSCSSFLDMYPARSQSIHIKEDKRSPVPKPKTQSEGARIVKQMNSPSSYNQVLLSPPRRIVIPPIHSIDYSGRESAYHTSHPNIDCISPVNSDPGFASMLGSETSIRRMNPATISGQAPRPIRPSSSIEPSTDSDDESYYSFIDSPEELSNKNIQDPYAASLQSPTTMSNFITGTGLHRGNTAVIKSINSGRIRIANTYSPRMIS